jgi:hypothetical protein
LLNTHISHRKNLAEHWDLPNTGIFYSKDVASVQVFKLEEVAARPPMPSFVAKIRYREPFFLYLFASILCKKTAKLKSML